MATKKRKYVKGGTVSSIGEVDTTAFDSTDLMVYNSLKTDQERIDFFNQRMIDLGEIDPESTDVDGKKELSTSEAAAVSALGTSLTQAGANEIINQDKKDDNINVGSRAAAGALKGAGTGASAGLTVSTVLPLPPGISQLGATAIGGGVGAIVGGVKGAKSAIAEKKAARSGQLSALSSQLAGADKVEDFVLDKTEFTEIYNAKGKKKFKDGGEVSPEKAKKILSDGSVHGQPLTDKQKKFFGAIAGGESQKMKSGGEVEGGGTAKSDSIDADVDAGSFIVPAENAEEAEALRAEFFPKTLGKKANLSKGSEDVKLSDGEHMFTPEEVAVLRENGIDLDLLAPKADGGKGKKNGGIIDRFKKANEAFSKRESEKKKNPLNDSSLTPEEIKELKEAGFTDQEIRILSASNFDSKTENTGDILNKFKEASKDLDLRNIANKNDEEINKNKERVDFLKNQLKSSRFFDQDDEKVNTLRKEYEQEISKLENETQELENRKKTILSQRDSLVKSQVGSGSEFKMQGIVEDTDPVKETIPATERNKPSNQAKEGALRKDITIDSKPIDRSALASSISTQEPQALTEYATTDLPIEETVIDDTATDDTSKTKSALSNRFSLGEAAAAGQIGIGLLGLATSGDRPEGDVTPELSALARQAEEEAGKGFSPEEKAAARESIESIRRGEIKDVVQLSGGNSAVALANISKANAKANRADLELRAKDEELKRAKQSQATSLRLGLIGQKQNIIADQQRMFDQNQSALAGLLNAGISNLIGVQQLKERDRRYEERRDKFGLI